MSSLLPKRGKLIFSQGLAADGSAASSIKALKTIIANKRDGSSSSSAADMGLGCAERKRKMILHDKTAVAPSSSSSSKRVRRNEDIDELKKSKSILEVKAGLYEQLQRGNVPTLPGDAFLVDFSNKRDALVVDCTDRLNDMKSVVTSNDEDYINDDVNDMIEVEDEFGRTKRVNRFSKEYRDFLLAEEVRRRQNDILSRHALYQEGTPQHYEGNNNINNSKQWQWSKGGAAPALYDPHDDGRLAATMAYQKILSDKIDSERASLLDSSAFRDTKRQTKGIVFKQKK